MKRIYIILTYTGTILSRIIKYYTKDEFSHVSIALDSELRHMYSFGRLNPYNPFWAGFVHERINSGTFKRFSNTRAKIYSVVFKIKIKFPKSFYCAEFVKYVLDEAKIKTELPDLVKPEDFKLIKDLQLEYDGFLRLYNINRKKQFIDLKN